MTTYEELLTEVRHEFNAFNAMTAKKYVPRLWETLKNENPNLSREDLKARLDKDCLEFWEKRTILEALPDEAKDQKKQKFARLSQKKRISAAVTAAPTVQRKNEIIIDAWGRPIESVSHSLPSSDEKGDQSLDKEEYFRREFSIPIADIWDFMLKLSTFSEDAIWFEVVFSKDANNIIYATVGERTRQIIAEKLQSDTQNQ